MGLGTADEMTNLMQKFGWVDYVVFVLMLAVSACVGIYWGFMKKQSTQQDYLLGGRNMKVVPVSMSLVARFHGSDQPHYGELWCELYVVIVIFWFSFISGITLLGSPTEVYMYGTQYGLIIISIFLMTIIMTQVYLPVFHDLKITSNYEYLSLRFDNRVRLFGSILFAFTLIGWLPIVIYVPALAFNQVTGVNIHVITPIVCLVCIFYTSAGGLQAVVWTDVIQITAMFGAMALVAVKGTIDIGGFSEVWRRNMESGRIEAPNWDPNPLTRHTVWSLVIGGVIYWLQANSVNQTMVQRYLALPTLRKAKWAVFLFAIGLSALYCFCLYCGLLIYAKYYDCDPLQTKVAKAKDQLLPLLVMDVLGDIPGLPGVFIAGVFSAALSSLSTSLNSMSAVVLEDFCKPYYKKGFTDKQANWMMRTVVIVLGLLCFALVIVVEKMGTILQLTMTLEAMTMGPQLGVFTMGILLPFVDATGALVGGASGLATMSWWCLTAQFATARGEITHVHKPLTISGCSYTFNVTEQVVLSPDFADVKDQVNPLLKISYMWFTTVGMLVTILVGTAVSKINQARGKTHIMPAARLLAPQIRRFCKEPPHPDDDVFISAFSDNKDHINKSTPLSMKVIDKEEDIA